MTSFSIESRIKPRLAATGGSIALLALLARCSKTLLGEAANGTTSLNRETALRINAALKELEAWIASIAPIRPDLRDARAVEGWLREFRDKSAKSAAAKPVVDPWTLLAELTPGNIGDVLMKHGWSPAELAEKLDEARAQLNEVTQSLAASNTDQQKLTDQLRRTSL